MDKDQQAKETVSISLATQSDSKDIWVWRNDGLTRQMFATSQEVGWEEHHDWYTKSLSNPNRLLYVGRLDGKKIGVCRFDIDPKAGTAEISINLNPECRGKALSSQLLLKSIEAFSHHRSAALTARIKRTNLPSIKCFTKCGFKFVKQDARYAYYLREAEPGSS